MGSRGSWRRWMERKGRGKWRKFRGRLKGSGEDGCRWQNELELEMEWVGQMVRKKRWEGGGEVREEEERKEKGDRKPSGHFQYRRLRKSSRLGLALERKKSGKRREEERDDVTRMRQRLWLDARPARFSEWATFTNLTGGTWASLWIFYWFQSACFTAFSVFK